MERYTLPKRTLVLWQIRVVMSTTVLLFFCFRYRALLSALNFVAIAVAVIGAMVTIFYLPLFFKSFEFLFKNQAIIINYGVFIKFSHIMPYSRLIYAQSFATPLASIFKVTAVSLKAARSRVIIPEIKNKDARYIIDSFTGEVDYEEGF